MFSRIPTQESLFSEEFFAKLSWIRWKADQMNMTPHDEWDMAIVNAHLEGFVDELQAFHATYGL